MRIFRLNNQYKLLSESELQYLSEANVANIKQSFGDSPSMLEYLSHYADYITDPQLKTGFIKKLSSLLVNDDKYLYAVRTVPTNAPSWATDAIARGELMVFQPNAGLNDIIQHLVHYITAAEQDAKQTADNNLRVHALGELQGFAKANSLQLLVDKSQKYFTRGSKNANNDTEGMERVYDAGHGYVWYRLISQQAFAREGKTLQNCIGRNYTATDAEQRGYIILVLRSPRNESVVAARIQDNVLREVKGKQNLPPIPKYMPFVVSMINNSGIIVDHSSMHDLTSAGYVPYKGKIYSVADAMEQFVDKELLFTVGSTPIFHLHSDDQNLLPLLFPRLYNTEQVKDCYVIKIPNNAIALSTNNDKQLHSIVKIPGSLDQMLETDDQQSTSNIVRLALNKLVDNNLITGITSFHVSYLKQILVGVYNLRFDGKHFVSITSTETTNPKNNRKWTQYDNENAQSVFDATGIRTFEDDLLDDPRTKDQLRQVKHLYSTPVTFKGKDNASVVLVQSKHDVIAPVLKTNDGVMRDFRWTNIVPSARQHLVIDELVEIANDKNLKIPDNTKIQFGIVQKDDQYELYEPTAVRVEGNIPAIRYDFTDVESGIDRIAAVYHAITTEIFSRETEDLDDVTSEIPENRRQMFYGGHRHFTQQKGYFAETYGNVDAAYVLVLRYGSDKTTRAGLLVKGNKITSVDTRTLIDNKWQKWDDYERIAAQLNNFAQSQGLTFDKNIFNVSGKSSSEFVGDRGVLATKGGKLQRKLDQQKQQDNNVNEITLQNGTTVTMLSVPEQTSLSREKLRVNLTGQVWKFTANDNTYYLHISKNNKLTAIYGTVYTYSNHMKALTYDELPTAAVSIVKSLSGPLNYSLDDVGSKFMVKPTGELARTLNAIDRNPKYSKQKTDTLPVLKQLDRMGWIVYKDVPDKPDLYKFELTTSGKRALDQFKQERPISYLQYGYTNVDSVPLSDESKQNLDAESDRKQTVQQSEKEPDKEKQSSSSDTKQKRSHDDGTKFNARKESLKRFTDMVNKDGEIPTFKQFWPVLEAPPFNMGKAGARTYYDYCKKQYAQQLGESHLAYIIRNFDSMPLLTEMIDLV